MVSKKDIITQYFLSNPTLEITTKELSRVLSMNYNTTRYYVWKLKHDGIIIPVERKHGQRKIYTTKEIIEEYVKKYFSAVLYCDRGFGNSHRKKTDAYAYTFEPYSKKGINRADDLYEEIRKVTSGCYIIDFDDLNQFGKNYGYGVEPSKHVQKDYIYPSVYVSINGKKVSF